MDSLYLEDRSRATIKGATRMISSTSTQSVVAIGETEVVLTGTNLEITKLDLENKEVTISGKINNIKYSDKQSKQPFLKRIFK